MPVSPEYRDFVLEQLERVAPVTARAMFGGIGIYSNGFFFALVAGDTLYFKVDDENRGDFEAQGMRPFKPFGDDSYSMGYYELPAELLEDPDRLREWMEKALAAARRKRRPSRRR